jgi:thioesterase domain-containing protein
MLTDAQRKALTARLRQGRGPARPRSDPGLLVPLGGADGGPPLFAFHAVAGTVHAYLPLAARLAAAYRVVGVQAVGVTGDADPSDDLAAMAGRYADEVCRAQPDGPVRLLGWSMGGVLAFETAVRLRGRGREVASLVLVDAPYRTPPRYADSEEDLAALFVADAARLLEASSADPPGAVDAGAAVRPDGPADVAGLLDAFARRLATGPGDLGAVRADLARRWAVFRAHTAALADYEPAATLDADALVVRASGSKDSVTPWSRVLGGRVRPEHSDGDHYTCLVPPAVDALAGWVRDAR